MRRAPEQYEVRSRQPVVLLAEDDDELRLLVARKLRRQGCDVVEARTGTQLVELVVEHVALPLGPDGRTAELVISDVRMPGRSGLEVLGLLRRALVAAPVILMTGFGAREVHEQALALGAVAVFDKPLDLDELAALARHILHLPDPRRIL